MPVPIDVLHIPMVEDAAIVVDGVANEAAWADAMVVPDLLAFEPVPDRAPTGATHAKIVADRHGLHFFAVALDPEPEKIRASAGRRDTRFDDDWVALWFDPSGEGQRQYIFVVNAANAQMDGVNPSGAPEDYSWDGRWTSAVERTSSGYTVEMTIPWRSIRHPRDAETVGLFVGRHIPRANEKSLWPRLDVGIPGFIVQEGLVGGPGELPKSTALALIPELTFGWDSHGPAEGPLTAGGVSPGVTAEWSPGAVQLLGTMNPDYSQVESDAAQVSINERYALSYEEKRAFFNEGREWFTFPFPDDLVYTRSMVTPLYGARATGDWGPWTVAALQVLDQAPLQSVTDPHDPYGNPLETWTGDDVDGRMALDSVVRVRKAFGGDRSFGLVASNKTIAGTDLGNNLLGVDGRWRFGDRWVLTGGALGSDTTFSDGSEAADGAVFAEGDFQTKHVTVNVWGDYIGRDLRAENGFLRSTDWEGGAALVGFDFYPKIDWLPKIWFAPFDGQYFLTTDEDLRLRQLTPNFELQSSNGTYLYGEYGHVTELFSGSYLTYDHGEGEVGVPVGRVLDVTVSTDVGRRPLYDVEDPSVGWSNSVTAAIEIKPVPEVKLSFEPRWAEFFLEGEQVYDGFVARAKLETFTSAHTWQRFIVDRDTFNDNWRTELLVAWEGIPGNAFYLGGSVGPDFFAEDSTQPEPLYWQVFAKGSWVFWI